MELYNLCESQTWTCMIGLHDINDERNNNRTGWIWTDGSPYHESMYHKWSPGEPNNANNEDCVEIYTGNGGFWNDIDCSRTWSHLVCNKYDPTTPPTFVPTTDPTKDPTNPTSVPTSHPTSDPTSDPTSNPTKDPTVNPTSVPTSDPTSIPTTATPTAIPSMMPTYQPSTEDAAAAADVTPEPTSDQRRAEIDEVENANSALSNTMIILISVGMVLLCVTIVVLVIYKRRKTLIKKQNDTTTSIATSIEIIDEHHQKNVDVDMNELNEGPSKAAQSSLMIGRVTTNGIDANTRHEEDPIMKEDNAENEDDSRDSQSMDELFDIQHTTTKGSEHENITAGQITQGI